MNIIKHRLQSATENGDEGQSPEPEVNPQELIEKLQQAQTENEAMRAKMDQLLGETKKAKQLRKAAEEQARAEAEEKARREGDFEQLHKSSESERIKLQQQIEKMQSKIAREREQSTAMRIAGDLAEGANAEILSEFVARRLKYTDDGVKVLDNNGDLTVSSVDQLKSEFESNARFSALLKGSQASGGSAAGSRTSSSTDKVMTRAEFDNLAAAKKSEFIKSSGTVID